MTERADACSEHELQTQVPGAFFADLLAALEEQARDQDALVRAADRARKVVTRA